MNTIMTEEVPKPTAPNVDPTGNNSVGSPNQPVENHNFGSAVRAHSNPEVQARFNASFAALELGAVALVVPGDITETFPSSVTLSD